MSATHSDGAARAAVMKRLSSEASTCVLLALARLSIPSSRPSNLSIALSSHLPTLFASDLSDVDHSYNLWLALSLPSNNQLSGPRQSLDSGTSTRSRSLKVVNGQIVYYFPLWILGYWVRLSSLVGHCQSWERSIEWLERQATTLRSDLAAEFLSSLSSLPLDCSVPRLSPFSTSHLPTLLGNHWLTDNHINAGVDYINAHSSCDPQLRVLNSYFLSTLELNQHTRTNRSSISQPSHLLKNLLANGHITRLLIPIHRPSHWTVLLVDITARTHTYIDSLCPEKYNAPSICVQLISGWLSEALDVDICLAPIASRSPCDRQTDSHSCGVAVLSAMAHIALGSEFGSWTQATSGEERTRWALRLIDGVSIWDMLAGQPETDAYSDQPMDLDFQMEEDSFSHSDSPSPASSSSDLLEAPDCSQKADIEMDSHSIHSCDTACVISEQRRLVQSTLPFQSIPYAQYAAQETERYNRRADERQYDQELHILQIIRKKDKKREYERLKKRAQRERRKKAGVVSEASTSKSSTTSATSSANVAELSRPHRAFKEAMQKSKVRRAGRKRVHAAQPARVVNWSAPLIWKQIHNAAIAVGAPWSPTAIDHRLKQLDPETFATFRPQRISQWRDHSFPNELKWKESHLQALERGNRPHSASTRCSVLNDYPDLVTSIVKRLTDLRNAGLALTVSYMRGYMTGVLRHQAPELFELVDKNGRSFECSESWTRAFLRQVMGWSRRMATRAAQKLPSDLKNILFKSFLRLACAIRDDDIPACCIVNADQTQVVYNMGSNISWAPKGERQVSVVGVEEKRALTLLQAISMSGDALPFQAIYVGKTSRSLPSETAPSLDIAQSLGFLLEFSGTKTYWSTLDTMRSFVSRILVPYFRSQIEIHNLPPTQRCVFQLDCWSVHRSEEFLTWMSTTYPWILLHFIPGGCTGVFQACDTGTQRVVKLAMRRASHEDIVNETSDALKGGCAPSDVINDHTIKTLRNRSVRWLVEGYTAINSPELIKKAFELCAVPETNFNLSFESLTSREARQALTSLRTSDPEFYLEITRGASGIPVGIEEDEPDSESSCADLDLTIPELLDRVLTATNLENLPGSVMCPEDDLDGFESEDYEYSKPAHTPVSRSKTSRVCPL